MEIIPLLDSFAEQLAVLRYSASSIKNYKSAIRHFLENASDKHKCPLDISVNEIEQFLFWKIEKHNISASHQAFILLSIVKFYKLSFNKEISLHHLYPKRNETKLPKFLTGEEVKKVLDVTKNIKHKAVLTTVYSCGLRLSELLELKVSDVKYNESVLIIRNTKRERKDRIVNLSPKLIVLLQSYHREYEPEKYFFEGFAGRKLSPRSVQQILKKSLKDADIRSSATVYTLRHSFAIHLLENGIDLKIIKDLLGHSSIKTTEVYTCITEVSKDKIKSPLDFL